MKSIVRLLTNAEGSPAAEAAPPPIARVLGRRLPEKLKSMIELGQIELPEQQVLERAVIGCVDLTWPKANELADLLEAWILKQKFAAVATRLATEHGMIVLNQGTDGLIFLANYLGGHSWTANLMALQKELQKQFPGAGLRLGVALGPTAAGYSDGDHSTFTAIGPEVDLAIRLCRQAGEDRIIVSSRAWYALSETIDGWNPKLTHFKIRGFDQIIPCMQLEAEAGEGLYERPA